MLIGELARMLGITPKTLRHYERIGLIEEPRRELNGYRIYSDKVARRAQLIVMLRQLELSLPAIAQLLDEHERDGDVRRSLMAHIDEKIREHELEIAVHQGKCEDLQARYEAILRAGSDSPEECLCAALIRPRTSSGGGAPAATQPVERRRAELP